MKNPACQFRRHKRCGFDPWVRKIPWRRKWQPIPVFLPGKFSGPKEPGGLQSMGSQRVRHDREHPRRVGEEAATPPAWLVPLDQLLKPNLFCTKHLDSRESIYSSQNFPSIQMPYKQNTWPTYPRHLV